MEKNIVEQSWTQRNWLIIVAVTMLIVWGSLLWFWVSYGEKVSRDPCSVCSEVRGENVICTLGGFIPVKRVYYPNGSVYDDKPEVKYDEYNPPKINLSDIIKK